VGFFKKISREGIGQGEKRKRERRKGHLAREKEKLTAVFRSELKKVNSIECK
jgi:hypothetical protein